MNKAIILDCEASGLVEPIDAVEIAYCYLDDKFNKLEEGYFYSKFMPNVASRPKAAEVHGFTKENLAGQPSIDTFVFPDDVTYLIGHNILYDHKVLKYPKNVKLICSKELSIKYLTKKSGAGTKGLNTLTGLIASYYPDKAEELISKAHSAAQDIDLCYLILLKILEAAPELDSFEKLAAQCKQPSQEPVLTLKYGWIDKDALTVELYLEKGSYKSKSVTVAIQAEDIDFVTKSRRVKGVTKDWCVGDREDYDFIQSGEVIKGLKLEALVRLAMLPKVKALTPPYEPQTKNKFPFGVIYDDYNKVFVCNFGTKHKGETYNDILKQDRGYLTWVVEKSTMNQGLKDWVKQFIVDNK
jgi:exodeoxyribonuclease X